jgi:hypothetical protein
MSFTKEQRDSHLAQSKKQAAKSSKDRAKPVGVSISRYIKNKGAHKYFADHVTNPNFPKPTAIVGGIRQIKYYSEQQLDKYFSRVEPHSKPKTKKAQSISLTHRFITTKWVGQEIPTRCTLAEDGPEL